MGKFINPFTDMGFKLIFGQEISKPILIEFLNFKRDDISDDFRCDVTLMDMKRHVPFSDKMRLIYLQLPLFTKEPEDCNNTFERIIYVLKNMDILERMPWMAQDAVFKRLASIAEIAGMDEKQRLEYDESLRKYRDTLSVMEGQYQEGMEKGMEIGHIEDARKMKSKNYAIEDIAEITGLTPEEIKAL